MVDPITAATAGGVASHLIIKVVEAYLLRRSKGEPPLFVIPHASLGGRFVGRGDFIRAVEIAFQSKGALAVSAFGIGGAGKTRFAAEFAHKNKDKYPGGCFWVSSETRDGDPAPVVSSLAQLQNPLGLELEHDMPDAAQAAIVVEVLSKEENLALIVLDNADNWSAIRDLVNRLPQHHVLVTTRNPNLSDDLNTRSLDVLDPEPALDLFLTCCGGKRRRPKEGSEERDAAVRITSRLGRLPLALEIAAAYLRTWPEIPFDDYDKRLVKEGLTNTIDDTPAEFETNTRHDASVRATFQPAWEMLEETPDAKLLLSRAAFFAPESIRPDLLANAAELSMDSDAGRPSPFNVALRVLTDASLMEEGGDGRITCHRIVADFVRDVLGEDERLTVAGSVASSLDSLVSPPDRELVIALVEVALEKPHLNVILEYLERMEDESGWARLAHNVAMYHELRGEYTEAELLFDRVLKIREKILEPDHPDVATSLNNQAMIYKSLGRYAEAEPLLERALKIREKNYGSEHPEFGVVLSNLAGIYEVKGRYAKAGPLYEHTMEIMEKAHGPDHPDLAIAQNNLAVFYEFQGKYAEAEPLFNRSLKIREKIFGAEHPSTAGALTNLGNLYSLQERYAEAVHFHKRALEILEKTLSPDHPKVATTLNNLANVYQSLKRYADAEPLYKRDLEISERVFGLEHPDIAPTLNNLANLYQLQGRFDEAGSLLERSLGIIDNVFGPDHPDVATALNNLAVFYARQKKFAEAVPLLERAIEIRERALPPGHPLTLEFFKSLAIVFEEMGDPTRATELRQRIREIEGGEDA